MNINVPDAVRILCIKSFLENGVLIPIQSPIFLIQNTYKWLYSLTLLVTRGCANDRNADWGKSILNYNKLLN